MTVVIGIVCFSMGALFGVGWMCALSLAKQADIELEKESEHGS